MQKLFFGTAGIPLGTNPRNTVNGIKHVKNLGLESMELEFVRNINLTEQKTTEVRKTAEENKIVLTCHGQYYVNLNSNKTSVVKESKKKMFLASKIAWLAGACSIVYHAAYYMDKTHGQAYETIKKNLKEVISQLQNEGIKIWFRPETGGKISQFGDIDEILRLSTEVEQVMPCVDFGHVYARSLGDCNTYEKFAEIFKKIENILGREGLDNMHIHTEGISYGNTGERFHMNLQESKLNYPDLIKTWKDFKIKGVVISESPNIESDAWLMKKIYDEL